MLPSCSEINDVHRSWLMRCILVRENAVQSCSYDTLMLRSHNLTYQIVEDIAAKRCLQISWNQARKDKRMYSRTERYGRPRSRFYHNFSSLHSHSYVFRIPSRRWSDDYEAFQWGLYDKHSTICERAACFIP